MLAYVLIFFLLSCLFAFLLASLFILKCLGMTSIVKKIITRVFSKKYDHKYDSSVQAQPTNTECFICIDKCSYEVVTTCNHSFCAVCILDYVATIPQNVEVKCPGCRKEICALLRRFEAHTNEQKSIKSRVAEFNGTRSKEIGFFRSIMEFTNIFKHLSVLFSEEGFKFMLENPRTKKVLLLLVYALSPVDLLPQIFLGPFGLIDDAYSSLELMRQLSNLWVEFLRDEGLRERRNAGAESMNQQQQYAQYAL